MPVDFLKDLPCKDTANFAKLSPASSAFPSESQQHQRPSAFMPRARVVLDVKPDSSEKTIVCDKTPILLRYLQKHWTKNPSSKPLPHRPPTNAPGTSTSSSSRRYGGGRQRPADDQDDEDEEVNDDDDAVDDQRPPRKVQRVL